MDSLDSDNTNCRGGVMDIKGTSIDFIIHNF